IVSGFRVEFGELRIVEDTEIVKLLFNRRRDAGQLLEIVRNATRPGQLLETKVTGCRGRRYGLGNDRLLGRADINAHLTLGTRNSVDCSLRHEIAVERHRATCIVIAWHDKSDTGRIAISVHDGGNWNIEPLRFLDGDVFLVRVNYEQKIGYATHVLDATERTIKLVPLALHGETLFLGVARSLT